MRQLRRSIWQNIADDERLQLAEQICADAVLRHVLAEDNERLDFAARNPTGDLREVRADFGETNPGEPRAVRIWIFVRADKQLIGLANARDGIADGAEPGFQF